MKNLSFGKILAIFVGFLLVVLIGAVVAIKMTNKGNNAASVTTKRYTPEQTIPPQTQVQTEVPAQQQNTPSQPVPQATSFATAAQPGSPAAPISSSQTPLPHVTASTPTTDALPNDVAQQLATMNTTLKQLSNRVTALESKRETAAAAKDSTSKPRLRATSAHQERKSVQAKIEEQIELPKPVKNIVGYKSMAVVGNRAWISTGEGVEDSVSTGETLPVPRPRVRSVDPATGIIIMTSDERIHPR